VGDPALNVRPKIYHITHIANLPTMIGDVVLADAAIRRAGGFDRTIGMSSIKERRLSLPVPCHRGTFVGDYVPFYFCPRSVMLYILYRGNNPDLSYREGQTPIVHLEADLQSSVEWAESAGHRWAFSLSNAGARYTEFRNHLDSLAELDWQAISSADFRDAQIKDGKQAEFLVESFFPWHLVERIGVHSLRRADEARAIVGNAGPALEVRRDWYY
jgi:hypothetical protein